MMEVILFFISVAFSLTYLLLIQWIRKQWRATWTLIATDAFANEGISVVLSVRNESAAILPCLNSILKNEFPKDKFEVIVMDDFSEDDTLSQIRQIQNPSLKIISLADTDAQSNKANKKAAITLGVSLAKFPIVAVTDGDCTVGHRWLASIQTAFLQHDCKMVTGPVVFKPAPTLLNAFQALDFMGMMGVTAAGWQGGKWVLANGANMAFAKSTFQGVGGYQGVDHLASGDDVLLADKIQQQFPGGVSFLKSKEAIVATSAAEDWPSFWRQRLRWGSKNKSAGNKNTTFVLGFVYLYCMLLLGCLVCGFLKEALLLLLVKTAIDHSYLGEMARWFDRRDLLPDRWLSQPLHILYIATVGTASLFVQSYQWKGRKTN